MYIYRGDERIYEDSELMSHEMEKDEKQKQIRHQVEIEDLLTQPRRQGQQYEITSSSILHFNAIIVK